MSEADQVLSGGWQTDVSRRGHAVLRSQRAHSETVVALLGHLEDRGFEWSPRPIEGGFSSDGREQLTYIEGASIHPNAWTDEGAWQIGRVLRQLHMATASFVPPSPAVWRPWFARSLPGTRPVIGHGDLGPWNIIARQGLPVGLIDWDYAGPVDALWELAEVGWLNAHLYDEDVNDTNASGSVTARANQLRLILDGYELDRADRDGFVNRMIEFAIRAARDEAVTYRVDPGSTSPAPDGFPILWAVTWRARSAAWMLDNRTQLQAAVTRTN